jgi:hypothetical protein
VAAPSRTTSSSSIERLREPDSDAVSGFCLGIRTSLAEVPQLEHHIIIHWHLTVRVALSQTHTLALPHWHAKLSVVPR